MFVDCLWAFGPFQDINYFDIPLTQRTKTPSQTQSCQARKERLKTVPRIQFWYKVPLAGGSFRGMTLVGGFFGGMTFSDTSGPLKILVFHLE